MRGGNDIPTMTAGLQAGSSPLARGKRQVADRIVGVLGIIPACAGETRRVNVPAQVNKDHPRLRGGNVGTKRGFHVPERIIPACAGETIHRRARMLTGRDHPRLRGGNSLSSARPVDTGGSSPLARGKLGAFTEAALDAGIIPACAGETGQALAKATRDGGSSPLARGKPYRRPGLARACRIIPACAGETCSTRAP